MINIMERDRLGTPCCPRPAQNESGTLAEFGAGFGVSMRQRATWLVSRPMFIAAPQTYVKDVDLPSAALHERSP
jgi:hypothetical protein